MFLPIFLSTKYFFVDKNIVRFCKSSTALVKHAASIGSDAMEDAPQNSLSERELILHFINIYRDIPATWRMKSAEYADRIKRSCGYGQLLYRYKFYSPYATIEEVKKKINILRTCYRRETKKIKQSIEDGYVGDDVYKPSLWYYDELKFLEEEDCDANKHNSADVSSAIVLLLRTVRVCFVCMFC